MPTRVLLLLATLAVALVAGATVTAPVRSEPLVWEPTGLTQAVNRLFTPRSGALLAAPGAGGHPSVARAPLRSDDGGATWRQVPVPPELELSQPTAGTAAGVVVDPGNEDVLYTIAAEGLYKTEDGGATWRKIDGPEIPMFAHYMALEVSPADPRVVYAAVKTLYGGAPPWDWWVRRSDDGGTTWQDIELRDPGYYYQFYISSFYAHPTDPNRVLRALGGGGSQDRGHGVELSVDRGATWTEVIHSGGGFEQWYPQVFTTDRAGTIYLGGSGGHLFTSTDDGQTWTARLSQPLDGRRPVGTPGFDIGGLAADPTQPSRAYVALNTYVVTPTPSGSPVPPSPHGVVVKQTDDGGETWQEIGSGNPSTIYSLAVGIDGRYLFAGTETGVWRLPLR